MKYVNSYLIQAFLTCPREAWLENHAILSGQDHSHLAIGRLLHETSYQRDRKEIFVDNLLKIDLIRDELICEIKKSQRHKKAARLQLAYYLYYLKKEKGVEKEGALLFPKEKRTEKVVLTDELEKEIEGILGEMEKILPRETPPPPKKIRFCKSCSYQEFCWA